MAEIAIDFLMGPAYSSALISWFGVGPGGYSHCASVLQDGRYLDARDDVIASIPAGVHIRDPLTEPWIRKRRTTLEVTQPEYNAWEANLRAKIGDQYGRSDIMEFMFDRGKHEPAHYICSALAINALQHIKKVPFPLPFPAHQISPNSALFIVATAGFTIGPEQIYGAGSA
jgi:hypothetical protein